MITDWKEVNWYNYFNKFGIVPDEHKKRRRKEQPDLLNVFCAFDIECSTVWLDDNPKNFDVHSFMYVWQCQIEEYTIIGRTWEEFLSFLMALRSAVIRFGNVALVLWVHNLAYEFTFLSGIYPFKPDECFFRDDRKPIYVRMFGCFEFRCSYCQTNMSLALLCEQMKVKHKLSGQMFDYSKVRYPWTELSEYEIDYITTDVSSLVEAMKKRISMTGDSLLSAPLTNTGYVRRECKESLKDQYMDIREIKPEIEAYRLLRKTFRGGNTHANAQYTGKIVDDVYSYDIASSYPTQQLTQMFPMGKYRFLPAGTTIDRVFMYIGLNFSVVATYQFKKIRLKNPKEPMPYISLSRCDCYNFILDNGRVLEADYIEISLTEIDLQIVIDQYDFSKVDVIECMVTKKDYLPKSYRDVIMKYYERKTKLKGDDSEEGYYLYMHSKGMLNAVYGMSATDPIHQNIRYYNGNYKHSDYNVLSSGIIENHFIEKEKLLRAKNYKFKVSGIQREEIKEISKKAYKERVRKAQNKILKSAPFPYQWGVYTTSLARLQLQRAIKLCGSQIVYCDTDSVKTIGPVPIDKLNDEYLKNAKKVKAYADDKNGKRHYIGLFEDDGHYQKFITQGAKRYAYINDNGKMGVTVSGVTKKINEKTGVPFAVEELETLERFQPGMIWKEAGGTMAVYNDNDNFDYTDPETGKTVRITKNVAIIPSTYEMTYSKDYKLLLTNIALYGQYKKERE